MAHTGVSMRRRSPRWCVASRLCAVAGHFFHGGGESRYVPSKAEEPPGNVEPRSSPYGEKKNLRCAGFPLMGNGWPPWGWHMGCIDNDTGDFVWKSGLIEANGDAAGNSAHLTPPAVGAECRQRFFSPATLSLPDPPLSHRIAVLE
jgi:hypothetical protein